MKIQKGQLVHVIDCRKGKYDAVATEDFDTDEKEFYPFVVAPGNFVEGMANDWDEGVHIPCRKGHCVLSPTQKYVS